MSSFVEAINIGHKDGLEDNKSSYILGLGVNYDNAADGTTSLLAKDYSDRVLDVPVSESSVTGMCVGMATNGLNAIVHHGRVEFALLAMDQILTQAAKWNFMFGGDYPCRFAARLNIGRQWGNGPQHTSSYNSLFLNTPGLDILWPSRPSEAYAYTRFMHSCNSPFLQMEHRWLFKTTDNFELDLEKNEIQTASIYGSSEKNILITYGDGLVEALRVQKVVGESNLTVICLNSFIGDRSLDPKITDIVSSSENLMLLDTSNYTFGLLQSVLGDFALKNILNCSIKVFSPPFTPVATTPKLVRDYYPTSPRIIKYLNEINVTNITVEDYSFDEINLPPNYNFSEHIPTEVIKVVYEK